MANILDTLLNESKETLNESGKGSKYWIKKLKSVKQEMYDDLLSGGSKFEPELEDILSKIDETFSELEDLIKDI